VIGGISFGGGLIVYLRNTIVNKHRWLDEAAFVEMISISQTLPGSYAVNIGVFIGDRLRGTAGAVAAVMGLCLPAALFMFAAGVLYGIHGERPDVTAMLHGVAAAAVGLVMAVTVQIGRESVKHLFDLAIVALVVIGVHLLHLRVPYVLLGAGALAIWWHRPRTTAVEASKR
ncbi:MAG TPA: chromate transporter, partial [Nitrospiria bacterium]|nr:chromate transporter [Nitrospiria bacterium]